MIRREKKNGGGGTGGNEATANGHPAVPSLELYLTQNQEYFSFMYDPKYKIPSQLIYKDQRKPTVR